MNARIFATLAVLALAACETTAADNPSTPLGDDDDDNGGKKDGGRGDDDDDEPGPPTRGQITGTVSSYTYAFDLGTAKATSKLAVDVASPGGDCWSVGCRSNQAENVSWNGAAPVSSRFESGQLAVCGEPMARGSSEITAEVPNVPTQTHFGLDIGYSETTDLAGGKFTYLLSWVGGCDLFGPCDADPSRLSEFHFEVTHPEGTTVLCPGILTPGATTTKCDLTGTLAPTYSAFSIAADPRWQRKPYVSAANVDVVLYEVPGGTIGTKTDKASFGEFLEWITGLLGPMPYGRELRMAGAPTKWLGFEHPANIILNEDIGEASTSFANSGQHVMMHEVVHQWSGDRTTLASKDDFVWKEAIAEYLSYVFEDEHRPGESALSLRYWDGIAPSAEHRPRPTDNPRVEDFYGDVYGPGPMVLFVQLEPFLGRAGVLNAIKAFLSTNGAKSVNDLRSELEKAGSVDLAKYFEAWVVGPGKPEWPRFDVTTQKVGDQVTITVTQNNPSGIVYGCKLDVLVGGKRATVDYGLAPTNKVATTTITLAGTPSPITVDPDHKVVNRTGTQGFAAAKPKVWLF